DRFSLGYVPANAVCSPAAGFPARAGCAGNDTRMTMASDIVVFRLPHIHPVLMGSYAGLLRASSFGVYAALLLGLCMLKLLLFILTPQGHGPDSFCCDRHCRIGPAP
ncbi:MAG: hypothetical protein ACXWIN_06690, partial [Burkholderiaceae bacterium]